MYNIKISPMAKVIRQDIILKPEGIPGKMSLIEASTKPIIAKNVASGYFFIVYSNSFVDKKT
ncbi:MAG: hypothetical protein K0S55_958, partial [Clostridia bacterium]|nr:hypothetical protein [Clostridia bacterium]